MSTPTTITRRCFMNHAALGGISLAALAAMPAGVFARAMQPTTEEGPVGIMGWRVLQPGIMAIADITLGGNTLLVVADGKALLVDTKYPYLGGALLQDAADQILADPTKGRIDLTLINTHHHADHTGGNAVVVPFTSASYAHANALPRITEQHERYVQAAKSGPSQLARMNAPENLMPFAKAAADACDSWTNRTAVPRIAINGSGNTVSIGKVVVRSHHYGAGHTDNDLIVHLPDQNILHTGDLVFNGVHPFFDTSAKATARGWLESLTQARKLCNAETTVIPGHGEIGGTGLIDTQIGYFEQLIAAVQGEIDKGTSKDETAVMEWDFMSDLGFAQFKERIIGGVYDELTR